MNSTNSFVIIFAFLMTLTGFALLFHEYLKGKNKKQSSSSKNLQDKDGMPIVPRHLRQNSEEQDSKYKGPADNKKADKPAKDDIAEAKEKLADSIGTKSTLKESPKSKDDQPPEAGHKLCDLEEDLKLIENTNIDFNAAFKEFDTTIELQEKVDNLREADKQDNVKLTKPSENEEVAESKYQQTPDPSTITNQTLYYTSGHANSGLDVVTALAVEEPINDDKVHKDIVHKNISDNPVNNTETIHQQTEQNNIQKGIISEPVINSISTLNLNSNSLILDEHLEKTAEADQNSPLTNASDNINISVLPVNEFRYISGEKLLQMVDDYGFKFGTMNMFHRYQNKDGTGILWFSMMGLTQDGIVPFDLNTLPTMDNLKGIVMFLPLPHPKVLQGFDSMMSIAGLVAREIDGYIVDEDGDEMTPEYKKKLRNLLQTTLVDDDE